MRFAALLAVAVAVTGSQSALAAAGPKRHSILVLELKGDPSVVDSATLNTITSTLSVSVSKQEGLDVLTAQDVKNMVDLEAQKQMLGCQAASESCLAEVANAMGAELVLSGDVGKLGSSYIINLHLFDASQAKSIDRDTLTVTDLGQLPSLFDASVAGLLYKVTGKKGFKSGTGTVSIPTVDMNALKSGGLKAINMQAETALEHAMDMQDDPNATPERKRDAWCALAQVPGTNPYLGPAQKTCDEWSSYVAAAGQLEASMVRDYDTLAGFLQLKRKSKDQKLEAIDTFLRDFASLDKKDEVKNVQDARRKIAGGDDIVVLPARATASGVNPDPNSNNGGGGGGGGDDGSCLDGFNCLAADFDKDPHLGLVLGLHLPLMDDPLKFDTFGPQLPPSIVIGMRISYAFFEGGMNLDIDFLNGPTKALSNDFNANGFEDDYDGDGGTDDDFDGISDDVDRDPEVACTFDPNVGGCNFAADSIPPGETPNGEQNQDRDVLLLFHAYAGVQTVSVGVDNFTFFQPSFGFDIYSNAFEQNDVGVYVANTIVAGDMVQLRTFVRFHALGDNVVRGVQLGVEGSLDYLSLLE